MNLVVLWKTPNPSPLHKYALVNLTKADASAVLTKIKEFTKLKMEDTAAMYAAYYDESPIYMSSPAAGMQPLLDTMLGDPLANSNNVYIGVTVDPVGVLPASIPIKANDTRLHVTTDGVYWSGHTGDARTYVETGFLDAMFLRRFLKGD